MNDSEINDIRQLNDFKSTTFSKYKNSEVLKELLNCIINGKIENACNWSAELICSGRYFDLWNIILITFGKHIHLGNPKLPIYIENRFNKFKDILMGGYLDNELTMRNNDKIRKLFAEIICVLCFSIKKHSLDSIKIKANEDFDITNMTSKLKAPNITYVNDIFKKDDPKELFIAINELAYHISNDSKDNVSACKWIEWILEFEKICKRKKEHFQCERRTFANVHEKFQMDIVWIIWDAILYECSKRNNDLLKRITSSLINIYCIKYNPSVKKKRRFLLYFAVSLLTENVNYDIEMIQNKKEINVITSKINSIYKQIKLNEEKPNTDYLFSNLNQSKSNLEKTIEKLNKMKELNMIIPNTNI